MSEAIKSTPVSPFDDGDLYDLIFHDFNYAVDFYVELAKQASGPVLDIACGTGRILLPCMQAGADIDGLDYSQPMLDTLQKKAAAAKLQPALYRADMSEFSLPRHYSLIMITFNAFIHNLTQDAQIRCLNQCLRHLAPGGVLVFDSFFPALEIIGAVENTRVLELEIKHPRTGRPLRVYDTRSFNRVEQIQHSINEIETEDAAGNIELLQRSEFDVRWVYKFELELLLRAAGFARWEIFGGFDRRPVVKETDSLIVFAHADWD